MLTIIHLQSRYSLRLDLFSAVCWLVNACYCRW